MFYVYDDEDDLIVKVDTEDDAIRIKKYYNGYILTAADLDALYA
jgi:hypothetical protein